ncbi:MAG: hypothetical protein K1X57_14955 [Gemmataceae bacterium]|nr:hypothetical protein [Gemmataceae bacterium]
MKKNKEESGRIRLLVRAKAKQCYLNAFRVIQSIPEYADADYVEGIVVIGGVLPIEHGWVERNGEIIDPTMPDDDLAYFAGLRFNGECGLSKALQIPKPDYCEDLPIFYRFGWGGIESLEFRTACVAAYRHAGNDFLAFRYETWRAMETLDSGILPTNHSDWPEPLCERNAEHRQYVTRTGRCDNQTTS